VATVATANRLKFRRLIFNARIVLPPIGNALPLTKHLQFAGRVRPLASTWPCLEAGSPEALRASGSLVRTDARRYLLMEVDRRVNVKVFFIDILHLGFAHKKQLDAGSGRVVFLLSIKRGRSCAMPTHARCGRGLRDMSMQAGCPVQALTTDVRKETEMEALVCLKPGDLVVEERPGPQRATSGEALVRIRRVGICGTDYHIFEGNHPYLQYPRVMGHELSASVVEPPPGSSLRRDNLVVVNPYIACGTCHACRKGRPNCCMNIAVLGVHRDGGMTELISVPETNLYPAGNLTPDQAATVEFLAIGAHGVSRAGASAKSGRTLVIGAGPIGIGAAIFAQIAGAAVTLMDVDDKRLQESHRLIGADSAIVANAEAAHAVSDLTAGIGFDTVIDATGNRTSMETGFAYVAHTGVYVLLSVVREDVTFSDPLFHARETTLLASRNALRSDFETVISAIASGAVPIAKLITHRTTLAGAVDDLPRWAADKRGLIKALIDIS
jgi:2-desacetyl-2-hydroxyethyl bacteriochlorophyllide A dehydrogenase